MPETPRTWTIRRFGPTVASGRETAVGAHLKDGEEVEVIEKAPVDAERERMLDLLKSMRRAIAFARYCDLAGEHGWADHDSILDALDEFQAILREHNRLQGGEDG